MRMPARGIDPSWLARPLIELGLPRCAGLSVLEVEGTAGWRWASADAAFLARVLHELGSGARKPSLAGLPPNLEKLLMLARVGTRAPGAGSPSPRFFARAGLRAVRDARELAAFLALLGEVVRRLPRFITARAKLRGADVLEVVAESSSRALVIVALVELPHGGDPRLRRRRSAPALRRRNLRRRPGRALRRCAS